MTMTECNNVFYGSGGFLIHTEGHFLRLSAGAGKSSVYAFLRALFLEEQRASIADVEPTGRPTITFHTVCPKAFRKLQRWLEKHATMIFGGYQLRFWMRIEDGVVVEIHPNLKLTRRAALALMSLLDRLQTAFRSRLMNFYRVCPPPPWREPEATFRVVWCSDIVPLPRLV